MIDAEPMTKEELDHLETVLVYIDQPFDHFTVTRDEYIGNADAIAARCKREQANFTIVDRDGNPRAHITVCQREHPDWEDIGPRLLATLRELQEQINDAEQLGMDIDLLT